MTEKRLSETMSDATYAVCQAQETLNDAITKAINTHFEAGIQVEQERIIALLRAMRQAAKEKNLSQTANINAIITLIGGKNE